MDRQAQLPDGTILEFPDGTPDAVIDATVKNHLGVVDAPVEEPQGLPNRLDIAGALGENVLSMATGALAHPLSGLTAIGAGLLPGGLTAAQGQEFGQEALTFQPRTKLGQQFAQNLSDVVAPIAESVGGAIDDFSENPLGNLKNHPIYGNLSGVAESGPLPPAVSAGISTAIKAPLEIFGATKALRSIPDAPIPKRQVAIPEVNDLFKAGKDSFTSARQLGSDLKPEVPTRLRDSIATLKEDTGLKVIFDETQHPQAFSLRNRILDDMDGPVDFDNLLTLRQLATDLSRNIDKPQARLGLLMRNEIDRFMKGLNADDLVSGAPQTASLALQEGRELWRRARNAEKIEEQIELAGVDASQFSGSGFENALTTKFRQLSRRIIKGQEPSFNAVEAAAIKALGSGGDPLTRSLRLIGKLAPTGVVSGGIGAGAGFALAGPIGAVALPTIGGISRSLAARRGINASGKVDELVRSGGLLDQL